MNKKIKLEEGKDFDIISWDWKDDCPVKDIVEFGRKYEHFYETNLDSDQNYLIFSDFRIKSDKEAMKLIWLDMKP